MAIACATPASHPSSTASVATSVMPPLPVERRHASGLDYASFLRDYVRRNRPVVVEAAVRDWPALREWTPASLKARLGPTRIHVSYEQQMTFADFIDAVLASREDAPGPYMYRTFIGPHLPQLLPDLLPQNAYAFPRRLASPLMPTRWRRPDGYLKLLIGGVGGRFPTMHFDGENMHATITEIHGDKAFVLYAPEDGAYLYPQPGTPNKTAIDDIEHPDLQRYPLFARAQRYETVLHPGDMVFVPSRWWHTARVLTPSISVCQNMLDRSNWPGFIADIRRTRYGGTHAKDRAKRAYLRGLGHALDVFEHAPRSSSRRNAFSRWLARIAPSESIEAADAMGWPMHTWTVG